MKVNFGKLNIIINKLMKQKLLLTAALLAAFSASGFSQDDGTYYLYDATSKVFLSRGCSWGTEASLDKYGMPFTWSNSASTLTAYDQPGAGFHIESDGIYVYVDNSNPTKIALIPTEGGYYIQDAEKTKYVTHDKGNFGEYVLMTSEASKATVWTLKTSAEHDAIIKAYPTDNISSVIRKAGLTGVTTKTFESSLASNYTATEAKTIDPNTYNWTKVSRSDANSTSPREVFQGTGSFTYSVTGLAQGIYKVTVNAFKREGPNADCVARYNDGYGISNASINANGEQVRIKPWAEDRVNDKNPNSIDEARNAFNNGKYKNELYTYVGSDGTMNLTVSTPSFLGSGWFIFGNTKLTYYQEGINNADATEIINSATALSNQKMNAETKTALSTALATFKNSKTAGNYNALSEAVNEAKSSVAAYTYVRTVLDNRKKLIETTNVYTADAYKAFYSDPLAAYNAGAMTTTDGLALEDPYPATKTAWHTSTQVNAFLGSSYGFNDYNGAMYANTWSTEGDADGSNFKVPFYEYWIDDAKSLEAKTFCATVANLKPGAYKVSANIRVRRTNGNTNIPTGISMNANNGSAAEISGTQVGTSPFFLNNYSVLGTVGENGILKINFLVGEDNNISWLSFQNVKYEPVSSIATAEDYAALNTAIETAEKNIKGFDKGEYAPYNNVEATEALDAAKAIDQTKDNVQADIQAATAKLTSATWTANAEEVNAINNGDFADAALSVTSGDANAELQKFGWTANEGLRMIYDNTSSITNVNTSALTGKALFTWNGNYKYGEKTGYTMPLDANTTYVLSFDHAGWDGANNNGYYVSVLNADGKGLSLINAGNGKSVAEGFTHVKEYFTTDAAGNYVLTLSPRGNASIANISILKAVADKVSLNENTDNTITVSEYADVTLNRTINANKWNTIVLPFELSNDQVIDAFGQDVQIDAFENSDGDNISFTKTTDGIKANVPYLLKTSTAGTVYTFNGVKIVASNPTAIGAGNWNFAGSYAATANLIAGDYMLYNNNWWENKADDNYNIKGFRAYLQTKSAGAKPNIFIDGQTTGINEIEGTQKEDNTPVYNLAGQKVGKSYKGIIVKNGKKVVVK